MKKFVREEELIKKPRLLSIVFVSTITLLSNFSQQKLNHHIKDNQFEKSTGISFYEFIYRVN